MSAGDARPRRFRRLRDRFASLRRAQLGTRLRKLALGMLLVLATRVGSPAGAAIAAPSQDAPAPAPVAARADAATTARVATASRPRVLLRRREATQASSELLASATVKLPKPPTAVSQLFEPAAGAAATASKVFEPAASAAREVVGHVSNAERDTIFVLLTTALVPPIMNALKLSPVLGFLFAGIVIGPAGFGLVSDVETTTKLAELGVVFFLFEMGLELELERLKSVGRDAFMLGSSQFVLTAGVLGCVAAKLGFTANAAFVLGGGLALSSSAFVIQLLSEKGELASRFGRASFGILLFQDLAVVPLLVVTPLLGGTGAQLGAALRAAALRSVAALAIIGAAGQLLLNRVFKLVANSRDQTAFLGITLLTVLGLSSFTHALGLSDTLGAFLAGVLLAETKFRYQIEADIAPFRGLLLGLFFITTGFSIDVGVAVRCAPRVLATVLGLHTIKTAIVSLVCLASRLSPASAIRSGLLLSQGGEFAFVIFALAQAHGILTRAQVKPLLTSVVLTMFLTPFLNEAGGAIASKLERSKRGGIMLPEREEFADAGDYVLVCGFGRVGQAVCDLLTSKLVRYKAFDMDPYEVAKARDIGLPVYYGDARRPDVLQAFLKGDEKAKISSVVIALDSEKDCTQAVISLKRLYPSMPIFVRASDERHRRRLSKAGATALETGPQESALLLGGALLSSMGMPTDEVLKLIDDKRADMYKQGMSLIEGMDEKGPLSKVSDIVFRKEEARKDEREQAALAEAAAIAEEDGDDASGTAKDVLGLG